MLSGPVLDGPYQLGLPRPESMVAPARCSPTMLSGQDRSWIAGQVGGWPRKHGTQRAHGLFRSLVDAAAGPHWRGDSAGGGGVKSRANRRWASVYQKNAPPAYRTTPTAQYSER